jgi:hypothetical protein
MVVREGAVCQRGAWNRFQIELVSSTSTFFSRLERVEVLARREKP